MRYTWNPVVSINCLVWIFFLIILHSVTLMLLKQVFNEPFATLLTLIVILVSLLAGIERKK